LLNLNYRETFIWAKKGFLAILDHGLFSGANFIVSILLARWLEPTQYGAFAVSYSVFLLIVALHHSSFTEPMMVYGSGKYSEKLKKYIAILIYAQLYLIIPFALLFTGIAFLLGHFYSYDVKDAMFGLAIAGSVIMMMRFLRPVLYVLLEPGWAAFSSVLYLLLILFCIYAVKFTFNISPAKAYIVMGFSALITIFLLVKLIRPQWSIIGNPTPSMIAQDHWKYGKWSMGQSILMWSTGNIYFVILPIWIGLDGVAALRALYNLVMPIGQAIGAISLLLLPIMSRKLRISVKEMNKSMYFYLFILLVFSISYLAFLIIFRTDLVELLYDKKYLSYTNLIPLIAILPIFTSLNAILGNALRVMEHPDRIFWSYLISGAVAVIGGVLLTSLYGIKGSIIAFLLSTLTTGLVMGINYKKLSLRYGAFK